MTGPVDANRLAVDVAMVWNESPRLVPDVIFSTHGCRLLSFYHSTDVSVRLPLAMNNNYFWPTTGVDAIRSIIFNNSNNQKFLYLAITRSTSAHPAEPVSSVHIQQF